MGNINKWMSNIIKGKTSKSLMCASIIFKVTFVAVAIYLMFFVNEYIQMNNNFYDNKHTHIIEVTHKNDSNAIRNLTLDDSDYINGVLEKDGVANEVCISNVYFINFGITDTKENVYNICALDNELYNLLGAKFATTNIAYFVGKNAIGNIDLEVPVISEEFGGYTANDYVNFGVNIQQLDDDVKEYLSPRGNMLYVSKDTYCSIIENMYKLSYDEFLNKVAKGEDFGVTDVNKILMYVNDIKDVKRVAKIIENEGYVLSYTLDAFENLVQSLTTTRVLGFILLLCFFLITVVNMMLSSEMYINNSQKDMGILLHYGFDKKDVVKMYAYNFRNMMIKTFALVLIGATLCEIFIINTKKYFNIIIVLIFTIIVLLLVYLLIKKRIEKCMQKNVLELLKFSKENE